MKIRTVLVWFVIAGVLAGLVAFSRASRQQSEASAPAATWTVSIDPAAAMGMALEVGGQERSRVTRASVGIDRWVLVRPDGAGESRWEADPERVRAALRLLATTSVTVDPDDSGDTEPGTPMLRVLSSDGSSVEIAFDQRASGGQVRAVIDVRDAQDIVERRVVGRLPASLYEALVRTDWGVWREQALFDSVTATAKAVTIEAGPNRVRLERGARGWAIVSPYALEADTEEVGRALGVIGTLQALGFEDSPPSDAEAGLDQPLATITVATDVGEQRLSLGRASDGTGKSIFARFESGENRATLTIDPESVAKLTALPEAYARRVPLALSAADIGQVRLIAPNGRTRFHARRQAGEWLIEGATATPDQRDAIERALRVLTLEPAARVAAQDASETPEGLLGEIRCLTNEGIPVASFSLRMGEQLKLDIARPIGEGREIVWTTVTDNAKGVALWASALIARG